MKNCSARTATPAEVWSFYFSHPQGDGLGQLMVPAHSPIETVRAEISKRYPSATITGGPYCLGPAREK